MGHGYNVVYISGITYWAVRILSFCTENHGWKKSEQIILISGLPQEL